MPVPEFDTWTVTNSRYDAHTLGQFNSVCTVSNGYLGLKGNVAEDRDGYSPVTLINGIYDELDMFGTIRASNEERRYLDETKFDAAGKSPAVANLPSPLYVRLFVDDQEATLTRATVRDFYQGFDLHSGVYSYTFIATDDGGRATRVAMTRFAALPHAHRAYMRYVVTPLNHDAPLRLLSGIDGQVHSNTTGERQFAVTERHALSPETLRLTARTPARGHDVELAVANALHVPSDEVRVVREHDRIYTEYVLPGGRDRPITLDRFVVLASSEDARHNATIDVAAELAAAKREGFDDALIAQRAAWAPIWELADVQIEGDDLAQQYLRFCLYHVLAAIPRHADRLPVPVKLLTGEYYQGNTFYDTDLYIIPCYTFLFPEFGRAAINFRWHGLEPGRELARKFGYEGAKFAWQSGPYGEECLGDWWMFTHTNVHINGDVAYMLMQYVWATGDEGFLQAKGIDLLVETARFYASRVEYDAARDAYDMHNVTGPDEDHVGVTNELYTNYLARQNLRWAAEQVARLKAEQPPAYAEATRRLKLRDEEVDRWQEVSEKLTLLFDEQTKRYEQCAGFYQLKEPPAFSRDRETWFETVFPYQALNQPDVVMALVLFRDAFPDDVARANWDFYKDRSMNFSSMSFVLNAIMAADMGDLDHAHENFLISAGEDIDEALTGRKDTYAGLHGTASGGAWMAAVFGFGGVHVSEQGLRVRPKLPSQWRRLRFNLVYRQQALTCVVTPDEVEVSTHPTGTGPVTFELAGEPVTLQPGATVKRTYR